MARNNLQPVQPLPGALRQTKTLMTCAVVNGFGILRGRLLRHIPKLYQLTWTSPNPNGSVKRLCGKEETMKQKIHDLTFHSLHLWLNVKAVSPVQRGNYRSVSHVPSPQTRGAWPPISAKTGCF